MYESSEHFVVVCSVLIPQRGSSQIKPVCSIQGTSNPVWTSCHATCRNIHKPRLHFSSASHFWRLWAARASLWCFMACFRKTLSKSDGLKIKDSAAATPSALLEAWQWKKSQSCAPGFLHFWVSDTTTKYSVMELLMGSDWLPVSFYCLNTRNTCCWNIGSLVLISWYANTQQNLEHLTYPLRFWHRKSLEIHLRDFFYPCSSIYTRCLWTSHL